jgi:hypothetical protein
VRLAVGLALNLLAFVLALLAQHLPAAAAYIASVVILVISASRRGGQGRREAQERPAGAALTPEEIKRRPVAAPEI